VKEFTNEEARAMRGTEFTYVFADGDTVQAFIAEVVVNRELPIDDNSRNPAATDNAVTCKALAQHTDRDGYEIWSEGAEQRDPQNYDNVICVPFGIRNAGYKVQKVLNSVSYGRYVENSTIPGQRPGARMATCSF
jgi:hypothetical protein